MNNRIITVVAAAMLVTLTSGCCSNMRSLWFGRGARCGLCNKFSGVTQPHFGNVMQAPCGSCETPRCAAPAPAYVAPALQAPRCQTPRCPAPTCQSAPAGDCGCNSYTDTNQSTSCGPCQSSGSGDCGSVGAGYPSAVDPYLTGGTSVSGSNSYPSSSLQQPRPGDVINGETVVGPGYTDSGINGHIIDGQVVPGTGYRESVYPGGSTTISPDNFQPRPSPVYPQGNHQSRKFDTDGKKILWEQPLPVGADAS